MGIPMQIKIYSAEIREENQARKGARNHPQIVIKAPVLSFSA